MFVFPLDFHELLLCVSLHLALEGREGNYGRHVSLGPRGSQNCEA